jgi:hypothetical protein
MGYLTIEEKIEEGHLVLTYSNQEVKEALYIFLMEDKGHTIGGSGVSALHLKKPFLKNDLNHVQDILVSLLVV